MGFRPANKEELFNLQYAQTWNVIEHIFGVLKWHFHILLIPSEYYVKVQAQIPSALCAIHNFIQIHNPKEEIPNPGDNEVQQVDYENNVYGDVAARQDKIAQDMWDSYQRVLEARGEDESGEDDNEGDTSNEEMFYNDNDQFDDTT